MNSQDDKLQTWGVGMETEEEETSSEKRRLQR